MLAFHKHLSKSGKRNYRPDIISHVMYPQNSVVLVESYKENID